MFLSCGYIFTGVPYSTVMLVMNLKPGVEPWISWEDTHADINRVDLLPRSATTPLDEASRWANFALSIVLFAVFGLTQKRRETYRGMVGRVMKLVGINWGASGENRANPQSSTLSAWNVRQGGIVSISLGSHAAPEIVFQDDHRSNPQYSSSTCNERRGDITSISLGSHPGPETISRDGSQAYVEGEGGQTPGIV
ncbi:a-factor receptor [Marasmius crinis-equi]|uniref:A-factor receptor n=1 Tax=Marasmius crinis-equi TaxID=585013 RepID=A0ABR3F4X5_9AGAR